MQRLICCKRISTLDPARDHGCFNESKTVQHLSKLLGCGCQSIIPVQPCPSLTNMLPSLNGKVSQQGRKASESEKVLSLLGCDSCISRFRVHGLLYKKKRRQLEGKERHLLSPPLALLGIFFRLSTPRSPRYFLRIVPFDGELPPNAILARDPCRLIWVEFSRDCRSFDVSPILARLFY